MSVNRIKATEDYVVYSGIPDSYSLTSESSNFNAAADTNYIIEGHSGLVSTQLPEPSSTGERIRIFFDNPSAHEIRLIEDLSAPIIFGEYSTQDTGTDYFSTTEESGHIFLYSVVIGGNKSWIVESGTIWEDSGATIKFSSAGDTQAAHAYPHTPITYSDLTVSSNTTLTADTPLFYDTITFEGAYSITPTGGRSLYIFAKEIDFGGYAASISVNGSNRGGGGVVCVVASTIRNGDAVIISANGANGSNATNNESAIHGGSVIYNEANDGAASVGGTGNAVRTGAVGGTTTNLKYQTKHLFGLILGLYNNDVDLTVAAGTGGLGPDFAPNIETAAVPGGGGGAGFVGAGGQGGNASANTSNQNGSTNGGDGGGGGGAALVYCKENILSNEISVNATGGDGSAGFGNGSSNFGAGGGGGGGGGLVIYQSSINSSNVSAAEGSGGGGAGNANNGAAGGAGSSVIVS